MTAIRRLRQARLSAAGIRSALDGYGYGSAEFLATLQIRSTLLQVEATVQLGEMLAEIGETVDIVEAIRRTGAPAGLDVLTTGQASQRRDSPASDAPATEYVNITPRPPVDPIAFAAELDRHRRFGRSS